MKKSKKEMKKNDKMKDVMHEYKEGTLKSSSGHKITDHKQAVAIGMSESGMSKSHPKPSKKSNKMK